MLEKRSTCRGGGRRRRKPVVLPDPPTHSPEGKCLTCHDTGLVPVNLTPSVGFFVACGVCGMDGT